MKCVIYARVSTADQETENQVSQLILHANKEGWEIIDVVRDVASGGKSCDSRNGLRKVFELAKDGAYEVLLFWSLDRLSREGARKTLEYLTCLDKSKVKWCSMTEPYLSSVGVFADAIISILSAVARQEKIRIGERTKAGLERARARGVRLGRQAREGVTPARAAELRAQGMSFAQIGIAMGISRVRAFQLCKALNVASDATALASK